MGLGVDRLLIYTYIDIKLDRSVNQEDVQAGEPKQGKGREVDRN